MRRGRVWAKTIMTRRHGRAPRGERLVGKIPHGHWNTTILIAALGIEGMRCSAVVDGPVSREDFEAFVEQAQAPSLRPGDVLVIDNLSCHKNARTRTLERNEHARARVVFLPPYSSDLNPIEHVFASVKQLPRSLGCCNRDALWGAMQSVLEQATTTDAANGFRNCGHTLHVE